MALSMLAFPMVLQSWWAFIPASLAVLLLIQRTRLEDRFLMDHLDGHARYASVTRWRWVPGVF